jgi:hypothetical protein
MQMPGTPLGDADLLSQIWKFILKAKQTKPIVRKLSTILTCCHGSNAWIRVSVLTFFSFLEFLEILLLKNPT